ncbi:MAG TPA: AEC family transporter [Candidatus Blautia intestinipullorum]|nr:AEC family transporter [Candidatus Blautia intestinipullorum]
METLVTLQITIFLLVAVGFVLKRIHIVGPQGQKNINDMVIYVILPCNILRAFLDSPAENGFLSYLEVLIISVFIQAFCVIYGKIAFRKEPEGRQKCLRYGTICSNAGFLGNPIAEGVYGAEGLMLASIYLIPQRIMMWSSGLAVFSGTSDKKQTIKKVLTHPCILACILGIMFMLADIQLPPGLDGMVTAVGNCNTAMSMMVIGMILADINIRDFWDKTVVKYTIHRLIIIPAAVYAVCRFLPLDRTAFGICVLLAAMPAGATTSILAEKYEMEPAFATKMVIFSTLLSLPTICIWSLLL